MFVECFRWGLPFEGLAGAGVQRGGYDVEEGYGIPQGNPFSGGAELPADFEWSSEEARPEIYLWGMRNPYRFSVDRETGALLIPDVYVLTTEQAGPQGETGKVYRIVGGE